MRIVRIIIGLLLLPCCVAVSKTLYFMLLKMGGCGVAAAPTFWIALGAGLMAWVLAFAFFPLPVRTYVLAHELTHAFWGHLMGAQVLGIKVTKTGGNVRLSESNFLVVLAPYFFPLYTIIVMCVYFLLSVFFDLKSFFPVFLAAVGFTLGFHVCLTVSALAQRQTDIEQYGRFFSWTLICFFNVLVIGFLLVLISPAAMSQFFARLAVDFADVWSLVGGVIAWLYGAAHRRL